MSRAYADVARGTWSARDANDGGSMTTTSKRSPRWASSASTSNASPSVVECAHGRRPPFRRCGAMLRRAVSRAGPLRSTLTTDGRAAGCGVHREAARAAEHVEHRSPGRGRPPGPGSRAGRGSGPSSARRGHRPRTGAPARGTRRDGRAGAPTSIEPSRNGCRCVHRASEAQDDPIDAEELHRCGNDEAEVWDPGCAVDLHHRSVRVPVDTRPGNPSFSPCTHR